MNAKAKHMLAELRAVGKAGAWASRAQELLAAPKLQGDAADEFSTYWIEAGHHMREQIADDPLLVRLLRYLLPAYEGPALELFRGENLDRWSSGAVGLAWTADPNVARMFGRGLNAVGSGGVLLKGYFEPASIISGPNKHSSYLGERQFTVDPLAATLTALEVFPAGRRVEDRT